MWISYGAALSDFAYLFFENKLLPKSSNNFYFHPANSHERENRPDDLQCICMPPINTAISVHELYPRPRHEVCIDFDQILRTFSKQTRAPRLHHVFSKSTPTIEIGTQTGQPEHTVYFEIVAIHP